MMTTTSTKIYKSLEKVIKKFGTPDEDGLICVEKRGYTYELDESEGFITIYLCGEEELCFSDDGKVYLQYEDDKGIALADFHKLEELYL